jgi:hypothetical protein
LAPATQTSDKRKPAEERVRADRIALDALRVENERLTAENEKLKSLKTDPILDMLSDEVAKTLWDADPEWAEEIWFALLRLQTEARKKRAEEQHAEREKWEEEQRIEFGDDCR